MAFKVIEDPKKLKALGQAQLLWYLRPGGMRQPSQNEPYYWEGMTTALLRSLCKRRVYAILLED